MNAALASGLGGAGIGLLYWWRWPEHGAFRQIVVLCTVLVCCSFVLGLVLAVGVGYKDVAGGLPFEIALLGSLIYFLSGLGVGLVLALTVGFCAILGIAGVALLRRVIGN